MENRKIEIINKKVSENIIWFNYILCIGIIFLHTDFTDKYSISALNFGLFENTFQIISIVADSAVPAFFIMSAILYYRNFDLYAYKNKLYSRIRSLLVPYLLWSFIGVVYYVIKNRYWGGGYWFLRNWLLATYNGPIWFLRTLILFVIISPIIYTIIKVSKYSIVLGLPLILLQIFLQMGYSTIGFWLPVYYFGAWIGYYYFGTIVNLTENKSNLWKILFGVYIALVIVTYLNKEFIVMYYLYRVFGGIVATFLMITVPKPKMKAVISNSFFVYCSHFFIIGLSTRIFALLFNHNGYTMIVGYFLSACCTVIIATFVAEVLKKRVPCCYVVLTGGRSK